MLPWPPLHKILTFGWVLWASMPPPRFSMRHPWCQMCHSSASISICKRSVIVQIPLLLKFCLRWRMPSYCSCCCVLLHPPQPLRGNPWWWLKLCISLEVTFRPWPDPGSVWIFFHCRNKWLQIKWLKATPVYCFTVVWAGGLGPEWFSWALSFGSLKAGIGELEKLCSFLETLGFNLHPGSFRLLDEFTSLWLWAWSLHFLVDCQLGTNLCS